MLHCTMTYAADDLNKQTHDRSKLNYYYLLWFVNLLNHVINRLLHGKIHITLVSAPRLDIALGVPPRAISSLGADISGDMNFAMQ